MILSAKKHGDALEAIVALFWRKGYAETSVADIVEETGLNRYALYTGFGSKQEIYLAALEAYFQAGCDFFLPLVTDSSIPPLERTRRSLTMSIDWMKQQGNGCFICHGAIEHRNEDPAIEKAVLDYLDQIRGYMEIPLSEAAEAGVLNPALSPQRAAQIVFDANLSLGIHVRAGFDDEALHRIVAATMAALSAPRAETTPQGS